MTNEKFEAMLLDMLKKKLVPFFLGAYQQGQYDMRRRAQAACKAETSKRAIGMLLIDDSPLREMDAEQ